MVRTIAPATALLILSAGPGLLREAVPHEVVVLDSEKQVLVRIEMDSGAQTVVPIPEHRGRPNVLAARSDGSVFLIGAAAAPPSYMPVFNTWTNEWQLVDLPFGFDQPDDLEVTPTGNLIVSDEGGIGEWDPETLEIVRQFPFYEYPLVSPRGVEVDSNDRVITSVLVTDDTTTNQLQIQRAGTSEFDPLDVGIRLLDYVLESDSTLIASGRLDDNRLYRIHLDTGVSEVIFDGARGRLAIDPAGQIMTSRNPADPDLPGQLVTIDLATNREEVVTLQGDYRVSDFDIVPIVTAALQPGDANQDLAFDQFDLVQVQQRGKYLSGQPATWGEGDWNGAPAGSVGNPPAGDGLFDQRDILAAQRGGIYLTGSYGAVAADGTPGDARTSILYDTTTGELAVDAPSNVELTSVNIDSAAGIFTGDAAQNLGGSFDHDADTNIFKATFGSSFGSLTFGNVAQPGLSEDFVLNDLTVVGSLAGGGDLGEVDLIYVPEPTSLILLAAGLVFLAGIGPNRTSKLSPACLGRLGGALRQFRPGA